MAHTIELYDALRERLGDNTARMLAEAIPTERELATKTDIESLRLATKADIQGLRADLMRWMLLFFVPLWIGTYGTLAAVVIGFASGR